MDDRKSVAVGGIKVTVDGKEIGLVRSVSVGDPVKRVAEIEGAELDLWVARAGQVWTWAHELFPTMTLDPTFKGCELFTFEGGRKVCRLVPSDPFRQEFELFQPSRNWVIGGRIIERERITVATHDRDGDEAWRALHMRTMLTGPTPLIAAMRTFVASKFGDTVPA